MTLTQSSLSVTPTAYGLFQADEFRITTGEGEECADSATIAQALWLFRNETIAVPKCGSITESGKPREAQEDLRRWSKLTPPGTAHVLPTWVWIGGPDVIEHARMDPGSEQLHTPEGTFKWSLSARLESNRAFYNVDSAAFFNPCDLRLRGQTRQGQFVARSIWPEDFRLDPTASLTPIAATPDAIRNFIRSEAHGGAHSAFATQLVWQCDPQAGQRRSGRPLIGLMLNGAQGDDDEAHGGHFALVTGRVGAQGQMHDWLVANYYTLDSESEKGIIPAMLPLEGYLADLNSGQSWYRPSYMLVATLREERTATHLSSALARVFNQFYRHQFAYQHAATNCTGISISTLRSIGWRIPRLGAISWLKAIAGLPVVSLATASLTKGKAIFDYFTEDQTRLFPAVAFEQTSADLLQLLGGQLTRPLTPYEKLLRQDVEEIMLVRIPQLPSSRVWGDYPVAGIDEYRRRLPKDPAMQQIIPVGPRSFPAHLKDQTEPKKKLLRSDYAVAVYSVGLLLFAGGLVRYLSRRRRETKTTKKAHHE